jgi:MFS family permease
VRHALCEGARVAKRHKLEGHYPIALATAILALVPYLVLTTAERFFQQDVVRDLGSSRGALDVFSALAIAAYAFGALLGGDLTQRGRQRVLFLRVEALFTAASAIAALAVSGTMYGLAEILQGFATGLLLIVALPPVIRQFPAERMPITAGAIDLGFFGAITLGPLFGGWAASAHAWRLFEAALAAVGAAVFVTGWLTQPEQPPANPEMKVDHPAIWLALAATVLPFLATSLLTRYGFGSAAVDVPLAIGLVCFGVLLVTEYRKDDPLSPVEPMWTTLPVVGVLVAMAGGGVFVTFLELIQELGMEVRHEPALAVGLALWPAVIAAIVASAAVGAAVRTRWMPIVAASGMAMLIAAGAMLLSLPSTGSWSLGIAAALLGIGAGATVSPGLWMAGFALPSKMVGRTFALIELVRSEADFILAPVILNLARRGSSVTATGVHAAMGVTLLVALAGTAAAVLLYLAGAPGLPHPDLEAWLKGRSAAIESPELLAAVRRVPA